MCRRGSGGCDILARPDETALEQRVYWSDETDTGVLALIQTPEALSSAEPLTIGLSEIHTDDHRRHAFHIAGGLSTQVVLLAEADENAPLAAVIPIDADTLGRAEALIRFYQASRKRPVPPDTRITSQRRRRLRLSLQAIDGRINGASYREIATVLYGPRRIAADPWKTSPLRDTVIGLVDSAEMLIGGGYRQLLRHRRRA